ncbi:MAG: hypothetical protein AAF614_21495 [Chloroflexota bacterium]
MTHTLFVGVQPLAQFGYHQIRQFAFQALSILAQHAPSTKHLCLTVHGPGYNLDESLALQAEISGFLDAFQLACFPRQLERITIVEINDHRAGHLGAVLSRIILDGILLLHPAYGLMRVTT